jgi:hypothetical protein
MHDPGLALDRAFVIGGKVTRDAPASWWAQYGARGKRRGLVWGGDWSGFTDRPHLQLVPLARQRVATAAWRETKDVGVVWEAVSEWVPA